MNEEMTVFGNSSKDSMTVTNIASPVDTQPATTITTTGTDILIEDTNSSNITISDTNNWNNSTNNTNNCINNINQSQSEDTSSNSDESLEPIDRLEKYSVSEIIFHRQVVARSILETLNDVELNDVQRVMGVVSRLASDTEPSIRAELVEQLPHIGAYFATHVDILPNAVPQNILPIFERFLTDTNSQVRKMTQNAFVLMLEQKIIKICFLEEHICPLLIQLTDFSNLDDYRMESVGMMSKIVRFLGKQLTERLLLQTFTRLCLDVSFHVRRVCAANFGEFCSVIGQQLTENVLLSRFRNLCQDSIWGVRKSCADVFVPVAITVSYKMRKEVLYPLFINLLNDQSRWVKTAAFQALGPFISTFADPNKTGLYYSEKGIVMIEDHNSNDSGCSAGSESAANSPTDIDVDEVENNLNEELTQLSIPSDNRSEIEQKVKQIETEINEFSEFQFWRLPIDDIKLYTIPNQTIEPKQESEEPTEELLFTGLEFNDTNSEMSSTKIDSNLSDDQKKESKSSPFIGTPVKSNSELFLSQTNTSENSWNNCMSYNPTYCPSDVIVVREPYLGIYSNKSEAEQLISLPFGDSIPMGSGYMFPYIGLSRQSPTQDIVPNDLLDHFLSMTNPIQYQTVDPDLCHHCAYSLPAVALTLGRQNWSCLRETYELLAAEMQWKIRWTLASSLHQMSYILGSELTTRDLLPIFLNFMKDLDEVRFGILQNLAAFLRLLLRPQQQGILPKIPEFLKMDNNRNWRFRHTLAQQIIELADIYTSAEIREFLLPISLVLLNDKVSEVRLAAIRLISVLIKHIFESFRYNSDPTSTPDNRLEIIWELNSQFADSNKWIQRQTYIMVCAQLVENQSIAISLFIDKMVEHLLNLSEDCVPNIRLVLARSIANTLWPIAQFRSHLKVQQTLENLQSDKDNDVRTQAMAVSLSAQTIQLDPFFSEYGKQKL